MNDKCGPVRVMACAVRGCGGRSVRRLLGIGMMVLCLAAGMRQEASAQPAAVVATNSTLTSIVTARFAVWDADSDGTLSPRELDALMPQPELTNQLAAAVTALKRATRSRTGSPPVLTLSNILSFATNAPSTNYPALEKMYREGLKRLNGCTNRSLFASSLPRLETIHQGRLGNCFCLAPLGAMVHRDPERVFRLFTPHPDGTCSVRVGTNTVKVPLPTDAELAMIASNEQDGIWVNLYEKAVGQVRLETRPPAQRPSSVLDAIARGGSSGMMLSVLTGHPIKRFSFKFAKDSAVNAEERSVRLKELSRQLAEAVQSRRLMTCGTVKTTTPGLTPNHAYAVLDYSEDSDSVTLWNPHGGSFKPKGETGLQHGYPQKDGVFRMPLADFVQQFSGMAFELAGD